MAEYSITELEELSDIKSFTIRMWERRYGLLKPNRTQGNIRSYDDGHLKKLLNISLLVHSGYKISKLATHSDLELAQLVKETTQNYEQSNLESNIINQLIQSSLTYDEYAFEKSFSSALLHFGLKEAYIKIIYPFLNKLGMMWGGYELMPAQEHFVSSLLRQKLFAAAEGLPPILDSDEKWLLFLPEDEEHETGLLYANYLLRLSGKKVIYLGPKVPFENLKTITETIAPTHLLFFYVKNHSPKVIENYVKKTDSLSKDIKTHFVVNSKLKDKIKTTSQAKAISSIDEFLSLL